MPREVERLVINSGPLIALARAEALGVVGELPLRFMCPPQVRQELDSGVALGYPEVAPPWLEVRSLRQDLDSLARAALDSGEAAVIQLALEQGIDRVCIDERRGRRAANAVGLQVVGSLGLLLRAKRRGIIPAVRPFIRRLERVGQWYQPGLLERVLDAAGEADTEG